MKASPKVVIVGAGSLFFGRKAIWQMVHSRYLRNGELVLVDIDPLRLRKMAALAEKVIKHNDSPLRLSFSTDRREVLKGADFVVLSFAKDNAHYRGIDCKIAERYGIRMCSGDTIGPGGIFRTMREFPEIANTAADIAELAPEAWVINYINPAAVHGIALKRFFPKLKSFAICDAQHNLKRVYAKRAGLIKDLDDYNDSIDANFKFYTVGPNHFSWIIQAESGGESVVGKLVETAKDLAEKEAIDPAYKGAKGLFNAQIQVQLYEAFGYMPTVIGHTKEYLRFWQGHGTTEEKYGRLKLFEVDDRLSWTQRVWDRVDEYLLDVTPISEFDTEFGPDPATEIIETMWAGLDRPTYVNTWNQGAVPNMAEDAYLELYCDLDINGPKPRATPPVPRGIRGLMEQILDTHELTAEAVFYRDQRLLRRAFLTDPLTNSLSDTEAILADGFAAQNEAFGDGW